MANCKFYLKKPTEAKKDEQPNKDKQPKKDKRLIKLRFTYNNKQVWFTFGESIHEKDWNAKTHRVKKNTHTSSNGRYLLNDLLDNLERVCIETYNREIVNGYPQPQVIKNALERYMSGGSNDASQTFFGVLDRMISNDIKHRGKDRKPNTIKAYVTTKNHLEDFEKTTRYKVNFESITMDFYHRFISYLHSINLNPNSQGKDIKNIKCVMSEAVDMRLTNNMDFKSKKFSKPSCDTDGIYLTSDEISTLYGTNLGGNSKLERVRDVFVFACKTGLRYSDFARVKIENIVESEEGKSIRMITQKTGNPIDIPCDNIVLEIIEKYNPLPRVISNQKFNNYIKKVCKAAKLNAKGRLQSEPEKEIWECVYSHTARRSFATNLYKEGVAPFHIMQYTGHRTEKAFLNYIKISKEQSAGVLRQHYKKKNLLKAV